MAYDGRLLQGKSPLIVPCLARATLTQILLLCKASACTSPSSHDNPWGLRQPHPLRSVLQETWKSYGIPQDNISEKYTGNIRVHSPSRNDYNTMNHQSRHEQSLAKWLCNWIAIRLRAELLDLQFPGPSIPGVAGSPEAFRGSKSTPKATATPRIQTALKKQYKRCPSNFSPGIYPLFNVIFRAPCHRNIQNHTKTKHVVIKNTECFDADEALEKKVLGEYITKVLTPSGHLGTKIWMQVSGTPPKFHGS